ncbi:DMT family transporter [Steroidobacter sp. S1-65]|uniref:DMT family transporter n=1 Tax=Steroidobacter gossypii TaxID=2805490 RepID=A0ABS1WST4_9GAMM|nr:DMT family transporter [Steroidobacter gossypii]MBM0104043.1 DMT family transporter [Steroidobacter gossypii]
MSAASRATWQIHFCVILWGFTAILGKLISLGTLALVWWRVVLVSAALLLVPRFWRGLQPLPPKMIAIYAGIGVVVALHWLAFYQSIRLSNASVAATCLALSPVFLSFIEPLLVGRRFDVRELLFGLVAIPGVILVVGGTPTSMRMGIVVGVLGSLLVAVFASLNKRFIGHSDTLAVTGLEMGAGLLLLTTISALFSPETVFVLPETRDAMLLVVLAMGCTLLPFAVSLAALRHVSAFSATLALNMEPVYAIVMAIILLGEQRELSPSFYLGVAIVLAAVFLHPWLVRPTTVAAAVDRPDLDKSG